MQWPKQGQGAEDAQCHDAGEQDERVADGGETKMSLIKHVCM